MKKGTLIFMGYNKPLQIFFFQKDFKFKHKDDEFKIFLVSNLRYDYNLNHYSWNLFEEKQMKEYPYLYKTYHNGELK